MKQNLVQEILDGWFDFNEWTSYQRDPKPFSNTLEEFGIFAIYNNFQEFLKEQDHYLIDADGEEIQIKDVLKDEESYNTFLEQQFNLHSYNRLDFQDINKPFLFGKANESDTSDNLELLENLNEEYQILGFINDVLKDIDEVTHASGVKNKYEVIGICLGE